MYFPLFVGVLCFHCFVMHYYVSTLVLKLSQEDEKPCCSDIIVLQMYLCMNSKEAIIICFMFNA